MTIRALCMELNCISKELVNVIDITLNNKRKKKRGYKPNMEEKEESEETKDSFINSGPEVTIQELFLYLYSLSCIARANIRNETFLLQLDQKQSFQFEYSREGGKLDVKVDGISESSNGAEYVAAIVVHEVIMDFYSAFQLYRKNNPKFTIQD